MFSKYQDEKTREWNKTIENYVALHKYIKEVGKIAISQGNSGRVKEDVQKNLNQALTQLDKALSQLKEFFKPCLTNVDMTDIFPEERSKKEIESLTQYITEILQENENLQGQLSKQKELLGENTDEEIKKLKKKLFLNEQLVEITQNAFKEEKKELQVKVLQLEQEIENLRSSEGLHSSDVANGKIFGDLQIIYLKKQQELEETLKAQNDLIYDLKQQLMGSARDQEIFKSLNRDLEIELKKRKQINEDPLKKDIPELPVELDLPDDFFHRSTLRIEELQSQLENLEHPEHFEKALPKIQEPDDKIQDYQFQPQESASLDHDSEIQKISPTATTPDDVRENLKFHYKNLQAKLHEIEVSPEGNKLKPQPAKRDCLTKIQKKNEEEESVKLKCKAETENVPHLSVSHGTHNYPH